MPLLRKKEEEPRISLERLHGSIPVIHPELKQEENSEGIITILIPIKDKSGRIIRTAKINLDLIGSKIWKKIDGKTTFSEISQWMKKEFVITEKEAEVSLSMFIKSLIDKRLIALILPPPKPGTPEVEEEIKRIKIQLKEIEKKYRKKNIREEEYKELKNKYEEVIKELEAKMSKQDKA